MKTFTILVSLIALNFQNSKAQCLFDLSLDEYLYLCDDAEFPVSIGSSMLLEPSLEPYTFYWDCFYEPFPGSELTFDEFDFLDDPTAQFPNLLTSVSDTLVFNLTVTDNDGFQCTVSISVVTSCWNIILEGCDYVNIELGESAVLCSSYMPCFQPATYSWTPVENLSDPTIANPIASPTIETTYCVEITDAIGCVANSCIDVSVGVSVGENTFLPIICFPNPTNSELNIQSPNPISTIKIYDITGRIVFAQQPNADKIALNLESLSTGCYFITATTKSGNLVSGKFIKD